MDTSLTLAEDLHEKKKKDSLKTSIEKKRKSLAKLSSKFELLRMELDGIKREYYIRVGSLLDRDNKLDMDIIIHKSILSYMKIGLTYEQAVEKINGKYYAEEPEELEKEEEFYAQSIHDTKVSEVENVLKENIKKIWKKAVMKFHPDLASDPEEKTFREEIMKRINQAYAELDEDTITEIFNNTHLGKEKELSTSDLERMLIDLENKIIQTKLEFNELKLTEWFRWKKKMKLAKKSGIDIFKEMEDALLDDVVRKMRILSELKQEIKNI